MVPAPARRPREAVCAWQWGMPRLAGRRVWVPAKEYRFRSLGSWELLIVSEWRGDVVCTRAGLSRKVQSENHLGSPGTSSLSDNKARRVIYTNLRMKRTKIIR